MTQLDTQTLTIGFFTTGVNLEYSRTLCDNLVQICKKNNVRLVLFLGGALNPEYVSYQYQYDYQYNVAYSYAQHNDIDGLILLSGGLSSFITPSQYEDFYSQYSAIPMVSIGSILKGVPSICVDNKQSLKELITHLIKDHGRKNIAFISGPIGNVEAKERYAAYQEVLEENHLPLKSEMIYLGDFTQDAGTDAIKYFIDQHHLDMDAIVCANDDMALAAIEALKERNIKVPEEIAVIGFDNTTSSCYYIPGLTTIAQPMYELAEAAFNALMDTLKKKPLSNKLIPSQIIYRESCGCSIYNPTNNTSSGCDLVDIKNSAYKLIHKTFSCIVPIDSKKLECFTYELCHFATLNKFDKMTSEELIDLFLSLINHPSTTIEGILNLEKFMTTLGSHLAGCSAFSKGQGVISPILQRAHNSLLNWILSYFDKENNRHLANMAFIRQIIKSVPLYIHDTEQHLKGIIDELMSIGIKSFVIYLYEKEIIHNSYSTWEMPESLYLHMGYINNKPIEINDSNRKCSPQNIINRFFSENPSCGSLFIHSISFANEQLGIALFELDYDNYCLVNTLMVELGCALKLSYMFTSQKNAQAQLKELSQTDELTKLLNRRGFFSIAEQKYAQAQNKHQEGLLFFADMDGLKKINDTYGHREGDSAIIAMSTILKEVFSPCDTIGRIGGDEFTILCIDKPKQFIPYIRELIYKYTYEYNKTSKKPYNLSITIGAIHFDGNETDSLEVLLSKSDKLLYEHKKEKKKQLINL